LTFQQKLEHFIGFAHPMGHINCQGYQSLFVLFEAFLDELSHMILIILDHIEMDEQN
jgi:hypothetical protein